MHTPGLWRHIFCPVQFTLVVDNFGVKFVGVEQLRHLVKALKNSMKLCWIQQEANIVELRWNGTTEIEQLT